MELSAPTSENLHWMAEGRAGRIEVRFLGRGPSRDRSQALAAAGGRGLELAWCWQVHGDVYIEARPGECGEGDALVTDRPGIALSVATADCVPVVVGAGNRLAVVHAGWRGIARGIVPKVTEALRVGPTMAWMGPAIGPCCYEVDQDVAQAVVEVSDPGVVVRRTAEKSYLSLHRAVAFQLRQAGVASIVRVVQACTRCHSHGLHSYRREGKGAGRNLAFAWLSR